MDDPFDELTGTALITALPRLTLNSQPVTLNISWPQDASYFALYSATNLTAPVVWTRATNEPVLSNGVWLVPFPAANQGERFYRLQSE
jgi:hypothetical protein